MKADCLIQFIDLFFRENFDYFEITNKYIKKWFYSNEKLSFYDLNQYYRFRGTLSRYLISSFGEYAFDFKKIINFYEKVVPDKEMLNKFKNAEKLFLKDKELKKEVV